MILNLTIGVDAAWNKWKEALQTIQFLEMVNKPQSVIGRWKEVLEKF